MAGESNKQALRQAAMSMLPPQQSSGGMDEPMLSHGVLAEEAAQAAPAGPITSQSANTAVMRGL
jgi:hypothetical protein